MSDQKVAAAAYMREWRKPHAERINTERRSKYSLVKSDPVYRSKKAEYQFRYYQKNRERIRAHVREQHRISPPFVDRVRHAARMRMFKSAHLAFVDALKNSPCVDCGGGFPPECMDFDHVRGDKSFNISKGGGRKKELLMAEIAKCDLVCANCHRIRTVKRRRELEAAKRKAS